MFHDRLTGPFANRIRYVAVVLLATALFASTNAPASAEGEDASALLAQAATTMAGVKSFRFELSTVQGQSTIFQNLELAGVEGSVLRPDRFQAKITAKIAIIEVRSEERRVGKECRL